MLVTEGRGTAAALEEPAVLTGIAMDSHGSVLICFSVNEVVREDKSSGSGT